MNLRKATLVLMLGSAYTVIHKLAFALFPAPGSSEGGRTTTSILWIIAASFFILFACQFFTERLPSDRLMRYSLILMMVFRGTIILSKLSLGIFDESGPVHRLVFGLSRLLNSLSASVTFWPCIRLRRLPSCSD
jgi:hypothetical protein